MSIYEQAVLAYSTNKLIQSVFLSFYQSPILDLGRYSTGKVCVLNKYKYLDSITKTQIRSLGKILCPCNPRAAEVEMVRPLMLSGQTA